jgi:hypothetical protein
MKKRNLTPPLSVLSLLITRRNLSGHARDAPDGFSGALSTSARTDDAAAQVLDRASSAHRKSRSSRSTRRLPSSMPPAYWSRKHPVNWEGSPLSPLRSSHGKVETTSIQKSADVRQCRRISLRDVTSVSST